MNTIDKNSRDAVLKVFGIKTEKMYIKELKLYFWIFSILIIIFANVSVGFMYYGFPIFSHIDKCTVPVFTIMGLIISALVTGSIATKIHDRNKNML